MVCKIYFSSPNSIRSPCENFCGLKRNVGRATCAAADVGFRIKQK